MDRDMIADIVVVAAAFLGFAGLVGLMWFFPAG
jgi:hypothetical protein